MKTYGKDIKDNDIVLKLFKLYLIIYHMDGIRGLKEYFLL